MLVRQLGVPRSDAGLRLLQVVFQLCGLSGGTWQKLVFFSLKEARLVREKGSGKWVQRQCHLQDTYSNVSATGPAIQQFLAASLSATTLCSIPAL